MSSALRLRAFHISREQAIRIVGGGRDVRVVARDLWEFHWPGLLVTTVWEPLIGCLHVYAESPVIPTHEIEQRWQA